MTKAEAIEAGRLAKALDNVDVMKQTVAKRLADEPGTWLELFVDGNGLDNDPARLPPWLLSLVFDGVRGVIVQRLAALGVDMDPAHG